MRLRAGFAALAIAALAACDSPPTQNTPPEDNLVNATRTDQAYPSEATGNDIITGQDVTQGGGGNATGAAASSGGSQGTGQQSGGQ